jgi:hypothetical protein
VNFGCCRRAWSSIQKQKNAAVHGSQIQIVIDSGKDLVCQSSGIEAVNFGPKELPTKLHIMTANKLIGVGRK